MSGFNDRVQMVGDRRLFLSLSRVLRAVKSSCNDNRQFHISLRAKESPASFR